jgi:putative membrane protein
MGLTIALNITWPLVQGQLRDVVTASAIQTFAAAALMNAWGNHGSTYASRFASVVLIAGFTVTATATLLTGLSFTARLGPAIGGVPLVIPLAWLMLLHPALELSRRATSRPAVSAVIAGAIVGSSVLYLEPLLAAGGYLTWEGALPDAHQVLIHAAAWTAIMTAVAHAVLDVAGRGRATSTATMPTMALLWLWLGSFLGDALSQPPMLAAPGAGQRGLLGMALVLLPAAVLARRR